MLANNHHYEPIHNSAQRVGLGKVVYQVRLLCWKRYCEITKSPWDVIKVVLPALLFFTLLILIYTVFEFFAPGGLEVFFVPLAFWMHVQRLVVQIMYEKSSRLQESMRMMGLSDGAYWFSYFLTDGLINGFALSFLCTFMTIATTFSFFIVSFFDSPQTASQATLALLLGFYVIYLVIFIGDENTISYSSAQIIAAFIPPMALQLAWYFSQVWPSALGVRKAWYFVFLPSFWLGGKKSKARVETRNGIEIGANHANDRIGTCRSYNDEAGSTIPVEPANESILGKPTVIVRNLCKSFGAQMAVDRLSFDMYENQIFALLGHNGAGKTSAINVLTGLLAPDNARDDTVASVYGHSIFTHMEDMRHSLGICPQHDVLFDQLTLLEHIVLFAQLKGYSAHDAAEEAQRLMEFFKLENRKDHVGGELSGGQKRMLSVAIAVCGGSKFVVFDEPTAGMDPLARRELWDLLASLRKGRTILLTTHYMDEADVLGDRVGIMTQGSMQCVGSTQFLKTHYGAGYKLVIEKTDGFRVEELQAFFSTYVPEVRHVVEDSDAHHEVYCLPFSCVHKFGRLFSELDEKLRKYHVKSYGLSATTLEDVFLKVGEDHSVTPLATEQLGIGAGREYGFSFYSQTIGLMHRRLTYSCHDFVTLPLLLVPIAAIVTSSALYNLNIISRLSEINDMAALGIVLAGFLGVPGLVAEFLVKERSDKLRNVLTVMGCDFKAYWIGTFVADFVLLLVPTIVLWVCWGAANMPHFYASHHGLCFFLTLLFNAYLISFSYLASYMFSSSKACISFMPVFILLLLILPNIALLICIQITKAAGQSISDPMQAGILLWGMLVLSPHGSMFCVMLNVINDYTDIILHLPNLASCLAFMIMQTALYLALAFYLDIHSVSTVSPNSDATFDSGVLDGLDDDVLAERESVLSSQPNSAPLYLRRLRKVFPPKARGRSAVVAVEDLAMGVKKGEIFGLLGANGAGKTTALSVLTRLVVPTAGEAWVAGHSILQSFPQAACHLGVVTQNNSLWGKLTVEEHLFLFARLRGVPGDLVRKVVAATVDQLELTPHRHKLAQSLSGGMKRKLCVAIALIGDPDVVLLDEPSAGLDPVSRRNLWSVILRTMSHRAVVLTTHSMEEAEALCGRIGIMVRGQVRVIGSKQHLKSKFGNGFELSVKLHVHIEDLDKKVEELNRFVSALFSSCQTLSNSGGQVVYCIPGEEASTAKVFSAMEMHKQVLGVEDYMFAQPTLEQVFIRTVSKHTPKTVHINTGISLDLTLDRQAGEELDQLGEGANADAVAVEVNKCGCSDRAVQVLSATNCGLFLAFWLTAGLVFSKSLTGSIFFMLGIGNLIVVLVGAALLCCACCKPPKGAEE
eukprot:gene30350-36672_t